MKAAACSMPFSMPSLVRSSARLSYHALKPRIVSSRYIAFACGSVGIQVHAATHDEWYGSGKLWALGFAHLVAARGLRMAVERQRAIRDRGHAHKVTRSSPPAEPAGQLSHLMKKCELKPVGSGTATAAFGEVAAWLW